MSTYAYAVKVRKVAPSVWRWDCPACGRGRRALRTLLEVTSGVWEIAALPLPLAVRTALIAAATGFGGASLLLQNRAALGQAGPSPLVQLAWQAVHGGLSGLLTLGLMLLWAGRT